MPYFPLFIELKGRQVVVIGGGKVASRKVEKLLPFEPKIRVVAPKVSSYIENLEREGRIELIRRKVRLKDLSDAFMVIVAVDSLRLQERVYNCCLRKGIHCNAVDSPDFCTFLFPALVLRGSLVVGVSTSGKVPALARAVREYLETCLPDNLESLIGELETLRKSLPKGEERAERLMQVIKEKMNTILQRLQKSI
jgi:precorrin-2 dehydrogenase/sirohydrochlorin ferrochelatase